MKILPNLTIHHSNLILSPDIHNSYPLTILKPGQEVSVSIQDSVAIVKTPTVTEQWNIVGTIEPVKPVTNQITDAVTTPNKVTANTNPIIDKVK